MVKGRAKRVVVVDSPDQGLFEQAIFIVGEETRGVTARELVEEARRVAKNYAGGSQSSRRFGELKPAVYALMGAAAIGLVWLVASLI